MIFYLNTKNIFMILYTLFFKFINQVRFNELVPGGPAVMNIYFLFNLIN